MISPFVFPTSFIIKLYSKNMYLSFEYLLHYILNNGSTNPTAVV